VVNPIFQTINLGLTKILKIKCNETHEDCSLDDVFFIKSH